MLDTAKPFASLLLLATLAAAAVSLDAGAVAQTPGRTPVVGGKAPDFTLHALDGTAVTLSTELQRGPVVLVLLRGWPGYHCPFCVRQFGEFLNGRKDLEATGARVVWIYPAASPRDIHADAFVANKDVPDFFRLLVDPGFAFTNQYGLRWDAPNETSYPSTFVIDQAGIVQFAAISRVHGGRTALADVLAALRGLGSS